MPGVKATPGVGAHKDGTTGARSGLPRNPTYDRYQQSTDREIPVVVLEPIKP
jgi:hypothetical protein